MIPSRLVTSSYYINNRKFLRKTSEKTRFLCTWSLPNFHKSFLFKTYDFISDSENWWADDQYSRKIVFLISIQNFQIKKGIDRNWSHTRLAFRKKKNQMGPSSEGWPIHSFNNIKASSKASDDADHFHSALFQVTSIEPEDSVRRLEHMRSPEISPKRFLYINGPDNTLLISWFDFRLMAQLLRNCVSTSAFHLLSSGCAQK